MKGSGEKGSSFFKVLVVMTFAVLVLCIGIPSVRTFAGQTGVRGCEANIATITRIENEYYKQIGKHTTEYLNLEIVNEKSDLYVAGLLAEEDVNCRQTGGTYQWQTINGEVVLVCSEHQHIN